MKEKSLKKELSSKIPISTVFLAFLKLGCIAFGGPVAHLSYFRDEFIARRKWLSDHKYADLIALCQFLPGPASSQMAMAIGLIKSGIGGTIAAWIAFTIPSGVLLTLFGLSLSTFGNFFNDGWLHGLKIATIVVVADAVWNMARTLCPDIQRVSIMLVATLLMFTWTTAFTQIGVIIAGGLVGFLFLKKNSGDSLHSLGVNVNPNWGIVCLTIFFVLLIALPLVATVFPTHALVLIDRFYRVGSLVFGGGHVVLPLLQTAVVQPGWVSNDIFLAGYGLTQAMPGPLFSFAAYLGTVMNLAPNGVMGGIICLIAIYLPSFLLVIGILPFYDKFRELSGVRSALSGINATVVGILLAAFYRPIWVSGILSFLDLGIAIILFIFLHFWRLPPWLVVIICAASGEILYKIQPSWAF